MIPVVCPRCQGTAWEAEVPWAEPCLKCHGTGTVDYPLRDCALCQALSDCGHDNAMCTTHMAMETNESRNCRLA